tara:strand:- start:2191 stop:2469 length:279 start_codon:yes stop_codon:yes gene_type:complete
MIWYKINERNGNYEYTHRYFMEGDIEEYEGTRKQDEVLLKNFYGEESVKYSEADRAWWLHGECLVSVYGVAEYDDDAQALHRILNKKLNGLL